MIEVDNLTKRYGALTAIQGVSFQVRPHEIVGFLGVNGAGKTTTMRILTGYLPATEGRASVAGFDVFRRSLDARRRIGYLPETVPLYTEMSVYDYLDYLARLRGLRVGREARIVQVMEMVAVDALADRIIGTLSKGQRQRVGIAQAIVHNPEVLILDEPTIGLDPRQIREVRTLIRKLGESHTILLSTHILPEVQQVCDRVLIISNGRIHADMTIGEAVRSGLPQRVVVRVDGPRDEVQRELQRVPGVAGVAVTPDGAFEVMRPEEATTLDLRPVLARTVAGRGWPLLELRGAANALEDLFLAVTQEDLLGPAAPEREEDEEAAEDEETEEGDAGDNGGGEDEDEL